MAPSKPYAGSARKLVISFDVGTTFSGIGYAILDPGEVPKVYAVTRFPGQENGDFKIPSILLYDQDGHVRAAGAEARSTAMFFEMEDDDLVEVKWFKLHLKPECMEINSQKDPPPLPSGKSVIDVFSDFLAYLFACAKEYIIETHPNGESIWASCAEHIDFVLSHPNGWEGLQQMKMRQAAVMARLIPDSLAGHERIIFVTEGEASLHYCINGGLASDVIKDGFNVMIVDAGGGTVDLSTYSFESTDPMCVEEISTSDCIFEGSTMINGRAETYLTKKLANSRFGNPEDINTMIETFEKYTKPVFRDSTVRLFIKFGGTSDTDRGFGIQNGQLSLTGKEIADLFDQSIANIVKAIKKQNITASKDVKMVFLVGGFAASPWLFKNLRSELREFGMELYRPDSHTNKAVAEGAVSFYLDRCVTARISRLTYGVTCVFEYDPLNPEHMLRQGRAFTRPSGRLVVPDGFRTLISKGTRLREEDEVSRDFFQESAELSILNNISSDISCYRGRTKTPNWTDLEPERFATLCTVTADTSRVTKKKQKGPKGPYYTQQFKIVLSSGQTEMKAQISWIENGAEKRGPAKVIYDDDTEVL